MFGWITDKLFVGCAAVLLIVVGMFCLYYHFSQKEIADMNKQIGEQKIAIETQTATINTLQEVARQQKVAIESLQNKMTASEDAHAKLVAQIHSMNIPQNAQTNRIQLQTTLNKQLNGIFTNTPATGVTTNAK